MSKVRLDRFLANAGVGTRSEVKQMVRKGFIRINDEITRSAEVKLDKELDKVSVAGKVIQCEEFVYYMFHKPSGCVTAAVDNLHKTVMDYFDIQGKEKLFPVGRLDIDTEGLLLITNDGQLAHRLLTPRKHVEKTYFARVTGKLSEADKSCFKIGVDIGDDKQTRPARLEILTDNECLVTIVEGRFHQIKRMFAAVEKQVIYLKRLSMGSLCLDDTLEKGCFRPLTAAEITALQGELC